MSACATATDTAGQGSKVIGVWSGIGGGSGGILGMYLSAILVDLATWRWLFVLQVALVPELDVPDSSDVRDQSYALNSAIDHQLPESPVLTTLT